jgi:hypothetical protein
MDPRRKRVLFLGLAVMLDTVGLFLLLGVFWYHRERSRSGGDRRFRGDGVSRHGTVLPRVPELSLHFYNATANQPLIFRLAVPGTLERFGFQASNTNSGNLLFVGGAIRGYVLLCYRSSIW